MAELLKKIDLTDRRDVYVVGDIHGCFSLLDRALDARGFDPELDAVVSVGDLVDRGPDSRSAVPTLAKPWFHAVLGNHELMSQLPYAGSSWHVSNGGSWFIEMEDECGRDYAVNWVSKLGQLPYALEVRRGDKTYGVVHASLNGLSDWNEVEPMLKRVVHLDENPFVWDRNDFFRARRLAETDPDQSTPQGQAYNVKNIDHVFFGHTPVKQPLHYGNCSWIDTGAFATDVLTLVRI